MLIALIGFTLDELFQFFPIDLRNIRELDAKTDVRVCVGNRPFNLDPVFAGHAQFECESLTGHYSSRGIDKTAAHTQITRACVVMARLAFPENFHQYGRAFFSSSFVSHN